MASSRSSRRPHYSVARSRRRGTASMHPFRFVPQVMAIVLSLLLILAIACLGLDQFIFYRSTHCQRTPERTVLCQHHHAHFLGLRTSERPTFQLQFPEVTTYQVSRSDCEHSTSYTAYQLDLSGIQADGTTQTVTFQRFDRSDQEAYDKMGSVLDLMSGARQAPLTGSDAMFRWHALVIPAVLISIIWKRIQAQVKELSHRANLSIHRV